MIGNSDVISRSVGFLCLYICHITNLMCYLMKNIFKYFALPDTKTTGSEYQHGMSAASASGTVY